MSTTFPGHAGLVAHTAGPAPGSAKGSGASAYDNALSRSEPNLFAPGRNCLAVAHAHRVKLLVDGEEYFCALKATALRARERIFILGWDFDSRITLCPPHPEHAPSAGHDRDAPDQLGDFLNFLVRRRRGLHIHVLIWSYPMIFGVDRELPPTLGFGWKPHRRVHFRYDNTHPVGGSHHQKIVVVDDAVAFAGGLDLTSRRWDTNAHCAKEPRRHANGTPYPPFHDLMAMVDGDAARELGAIARQRWRLATDEIIRASRHIVSRPATRFAALARRLGARRFAGRFEDVWPQDMSSDMHDVPVAVSRTLPGVNGHEQVREVEALYLDMIRAARRCIYAENQYFTSHRVCDALCARLQEKDGPEVVLVIRLLSHGWLEQHTMEALRTRLVKRLRAADRWGRLGVYYPHTDDLADGTCIDVHSKAMMVDETWLRIGSANLSNRSMGMDTECDLTVEAHDEPTACAIVSFRNRLLGEHLGAAAEDVRAAIQSEGSVNAAIAKLSAQKGRTFRPLTEPLSSDTLVELASIADPERPVSLENLVGEFAPRSAAVETVPSDRPTAPAWKVFALVALVFAGLAALWSFTPLADQIAPERVVALARDFGSQWWAPLLVIAAYTPACFTMFPRPLVTLFGVIAFGTKMAIVYAICGVMVSALVTYVAGRMMNPATVKRLAGSKLDHVSGVLRRRGLVTMTAIRLVPVAPFAVIGIVAGALRIRLRDYMLGTLLGLAPGTVVTLVFGNQVEGLIDHNGEINYALLAAVGVAFVIGIWAVRRFVFGGGFFKHPPAPG